MDLSDTRSPVGKGEKDYATDVVGLDKELTQNGDELGFSNIDEKKVLRKMDVRLIPVLALLYLLSFLDVSPRLRLFSNSQGEQLSPIDQKEPQYDEWNVLTSMSVAWKYRQRENSRPRRGPSSDWRTIQSMSYGYVSTPMPTSQRLTLSHSLLFHLLRFRSSF
jgi:hypothetical protein